MARGGVRATIFALASAPGRAAIAVLRLSGPAAGDVCRRLTGAAAAAAAGDVARSATRRAASRSIAALVLWFPGPAQRHRRGRGWNCRSMAAGRWSRRCSTALAALPGLRPAEPGEFTRRAFLNGRLDLTAVEGLGRPDRRRDRGPAAPGAAPGWTATLARLYDGWRERSARRLWRGSRPRSTLRRGGGAGRPAGGGASARSVALAAEIAAASRPTAGAASGCATGCRVVIAGPPNAGKSSLLNRLARREVAIVSPRAGTTRDVIEVRLDLGGYPVTFCAIRRAARAADASRERRACGGRGRGSAEADLVLWLRDATLGLDGGRVGAGLRAPGAAGAGTRPILRRRRPSGGHRHAIVGSTGRRASTDLAGADLCGHGGAPPCGPVGDRSPDHAARHRAALQAAVAALARAADWRCGRSELVAEELRLASPRAWAAIDRPGRRRGRAGRRSSVSSASANRPATFHVKRSVSDAGQSGESL